MSTFLQFITLLAIILIAAKAAGYLSLRLHQPSVLGELLIGLILGPSLLNLVHWPVFDSEIMTLLVADFSEIGVLLLIFYAGLELHLTELTSNLKISFLAGIFGVVIPVGAGWLTGLAFGFEGFESVFLGLALGATSVSISAQTLIELKVLRSRVGLGLLGAAVFDDVLIILVLSALLAFFDGSDGLSSILLIFLRMLLFFLLSSAFGLWILPKITRRVSRLPISQGVLTLGFVVMLVYGVAAEWLGNIAAITGAFLAGLMFGRTPEKERLQAGMNALAYGLFVPVFFVNIGLEVDIRQIQSDEFFLLIAITFVAIFGKLLGAGWGARLAGFNWLESLQLGAGMVSRGEVGLILASVAISNNIMSMGVFTDIVFVVLITTLVTPPMLRYMFRLTQPGAGAVMQPASRKEME